MSKSTLIFATGNMHKLEEVNEKLSSTNFVAKAMKDYGVTVDIPETGDTMNENARQKAAYLSNALKIDCFAEDSGLEIDSLDMRPGIYTARYAGPQRDNDDNMDKVLSELKGVKNRAAQFRAVICLIVGEVTHYFEGIVKGSIAMEKRGVGGFGYDPIFIPEGYIQSFAELPDSVKATISHRAIAVDKLVTFLNSRKV